MRTPSPRQPAIVVVAATRERLVLLQRLLRDLTRDVDIIPAQTTAVALAHLTDRPVPLVLIDDPGPAPSGVSLVAAIKRLTPNTGVVLLTADAATTRHRRVPSADYTVATPIPFTRLAQIVGTLLNGWMTYSIP